MTHLYNFTPYREHDGGLTEATSVQMKKLSVPAKQREVLKQVPPAELMFPKRELAFALDFVDCRPTRIHINLESR